MWEAGIYAPAPRPKTPYDVEVRRRTRERRVRQKVRLQQRHRRRRTLVLILLALVAFLLVVPSLLPEPEPLARVSVPDTAPLSVPSINAGELRTDLENIARAHDGTYGVVVYDPESESTVSLDSTRPFYAASLAKLPTLYSLYRAADGGELSLDEPISILPTDVQSYGSGVLYQYPLGYDMSLRRCARYLIQESDNTAWVMLERRLGVERIQSDLFSVGATHTDYAALQTTPDDVLAMLKAISDPERTSEEHSREMLDLMTDTAYEDRIPKPLPDDVRVAHKVGSYAGTYSDAAVVFGEGEEPYYIVVISEGATEAEARAAIRQMSLATYEALR